MDPRVISELFTAGYGTQILTRDARVIQRPGWYQVISPGSPIPSRNEIIHSAIRPEKVEETVDEVIAEYQKIPTAFKWCTSPLTKPINLPEILIRKGFASWRTQDMFFEIDDTPKVQTSKLLIEPVSRENLSDYIDCYFQGWKLEAAPTLQERENLREDLLWSQLHQADKAFFYLGRVNGEPAATCGLFLKEHSGYLMGGNVLPKFRGKGHYQSLIDYRLNKIASSGRNLAITGAREATSAPILAKYGFKTAFRSNVFQFGGVLP